MGQRQVPPFLLNRTDSFNLKHDISNLKLLLVWRAVNGNKLFDRQAAVELQHELQAQREARLKKAEHERLKQREHTQKIYSDLCQSIAELCFSVEILGDIKEVNVGQVGWTAKIRDELTGKVVGTPRTLLNGVDSPVDMGWDSVNANAVDDLRNYLIQLKDKFDGFQYPFSFTRERRRFFGVQRAPFPPESPKFFRFTIRLIYQPFNMGEIERKVRKLLEHVYPHAQ